MKLHSNLRGFEDMDKALAALPQRVENKVMQRAVTRALRPARQAIREETPIGDTRSPASKEYGRARSNIRLHRLRKVKKGSKGARITTGRAFWLMFYELGTRYQPARPFFARAFKRMQEAILKDLAKELGEGIEREAKFRGGFRGGK